MPNFFQHHYFKVTPKSKSMQGVLAATKLSKLDCYARLVNFKRFSADLPRGLWWLLLCSASLQVVSVYLPFVSWFTWPFLVYVCVQSVQERGGQDLSALQHVLQILGTLKSKGEVIIALILYGALSLIIFRGLMEALSWAHIDWDLLPRSVISLLPYTLSEAFAVLFIATCAFRLNLDDRDPFKILSLSVRDLFVTPFSTLLILFLQSVVWTAVAMSLAFYFQSALMSSFLGHAPFILFVLVWVCGQPIEREDISWVESL